MRKLVPTLLLMILPIAARAQVFESLIGHKLCFDSGHTSLFLPNGEYVEDGKRMGSWAHIAGDTIDWSSNRTGRGPVEFTRQGESIVVIFAGRTRSAKVCK